MNNNNFGKNIGLGDIARLNKKTIKKWRKREPMPAKYT